MIVESFASKQEHDANETEDDETKNSKDDAILDRVMILIATPEVVTAGQRK